MWPARRVTAGILRDIDVFNSIATVMEVLDRRLLAKVQVTEVGEAGERYLVVAGYVEAKLAQAEIDAGLCTAIQQRPMVTVLDLVD